MTSEIFTAEFIRVYGAHRTRFQLFGDTAPVGALDPTPNQFLPPLDTDLNEQHQILQQIIQEHKHLIQSAFPYTIVMQQDGDLHIRDGHKIDDFLWSQNSLMCRGMLLRLAGEHDGTVVMQMDDGKSRSLFDRDKSTNKSVFFEILMQSMLLGQWTRGDKGDVNGAGCTVHIRDGGMVYDKKLIITDPYLVPVISRDIYGVRYIPTGNDGAYIHPNVKNPLFSIEGI